MTRTSPFPLVSSPRILAAAFALVALFASRTRAGEITVTPLTRDGQVQVSFDLSDGFTSEVRDAIQSGLATTFSYTLELRRGAATWFDVTIAQVTVSATVRFDNLTRRYQMSRSVNGHVEDGGPTADEDAVRRWMTHFERIPLSTTSSLEVNGEYYVRVRAQTRPRNAWVIWPWDGGSALGRAKFTFIQ